MADALDQLLARLPAARSKGDALDTLLAGMPNVPAQQSVKPSSVLPAPDVVAQQSTANARAFAEAATWPATPDQVTFSPIPMPPPGSTQDELHPVLTAMAEPARWFLRAGPGQVVEGVQQIAGAFPDNRHETTGPRLRGETADSRQIAAGGTKVLGGAMTTSAPLVLPALAAAPVATTVTIGSGIAADRGTAAGLEAAGVSPEWAEFVGAIAGVGVGGKVGKHFYDKLYTAAGSPTIEFGKIETPKEFSAMSDAELLAHANKVAREQPPNAEWQREQIAKEVLKRKAGRGMQEREQPADAATSGFPPAPSAPPVPSAPAVVGNVPAAGDPLTWTKQQIAAGQKVSTATLQRRFKLGYGAATTILDQATEPRATSAAPSPAAPRPAAPALPRALAGAKPRYAFGERQFDLSFADDVDRAAYITAQSSRSKRDAQYLDFAMKATGLSEEEVRGHGKKVRAQIKELARHAEPGLLKVPEVGSYWRAPVARPTTAPAVATPVAPPAPVLSEPGPAAPAVETSQAERAPSKTPTYGKDVAVAVPGELTTYPARYALREASDVHPSHNAFSFEPNPDYQYRNDRDYRTASNAARVADQAGQFNPEFVSMESPTAEHGAPVIDRRGNVLGGNSRAMTLGRVYASNPGAADDYRAAVRGRAASYGFDPAEVDRFDRPVLVREMTTQPDDATAQRAITDFNKTGAAALSPAERAVTDGRRLSPTTIERIAAKLENVGEGSTLAQAMRGENGAEIVNSLVEDGVVTPQERNGLIDERGQLTGDAKDRIAKMLTGRLFESPGSFQSTPPELRNKLDRVAPHVLRLEGRPEWNLMPTVREAVAAISDARAHGIKNFDDLARQTTLAGESRSYSPEAIAIARTLGQGPVAAERAFRQFANEEVMSRDGSQSAFFDAPTRQEAFDAAFSNAQFARELTRPVPSGSTRDQVYSSSDWEVLPARGESRPARIRINAAARRAIGDAIGTQFTGAELSRADASILADALTGHAVAKLEAGEISTDTANRLGELADALEQGGSTGAILYQSDGSISIGQRARNLREELTHWKQRKYGDVGANEAVHRAVAAHRAFPLVRRALKKRGYGDVLWHQVNELGAKLAAGETTSLGLSRKLAMDLLGHYNAQMIRHHGPEAAREILGYAERSVRRLFANESDRRAAGALRRRIAGQPATNAGPATASGILPRRPGANGDGVQPALSRATFQFSRAHEEGLTPPPGLGPDFKKQTSASRDLRDIFRPMGARIAREGTEGREIARKLNRAADVGEINAGKRIVQLRDAGLQDLSREDRQNLVDAMQGFAEPANDAVERTLEGIREVTAGIAREAVASNVMTKEQRTLQPWDRIPLEAELTRRQQEMREAGQNISITYSRPFRGRENYYPHVIPATDALKSGQVRQDVIDNIVRNDLLPEGIPSTSENAVSLIDDYRQFIDEGGRARMVERYLVDSGQARDIEEARSLMQRFRTNVRRDGGLEYARSANLPFYDPDPGRVLPKYVAARSMRIAQIREFGQERELIEHLIQGIESTGGDEKFVKYAVDRALNLVNEPDSALARVSRMVRMVQGFKLGLSSIPNATQGALNSLLKSDLPSTIAGGRGLMSAEGRRFAMQSGASIEGVINEMIRVVGAENQALGTFLRGTGFTATEQANRIWAANTGYAYAKRMLGRLQKNPKDGRARKVLEELGLKPDVLLRIGEIKGDAALMAAKKFADITQFRSRPQDLPEFASTEGGKIFFQFKSFTYGQSRLLYSELVEEIRARRFGRGLRTLLILATIFPLAGEVVSDLRSLIRGRERPRKALERYYDDAAQGGLGIAVDAYQAGKLGKTADFIAGPTLSDAAELVNIASRPKRMKNLAKLLLRRVPLLGDVFSSRVFPPENKGRR